VRSIVVSGYISVVVQFCVKFVTLTLSSWYGLLSLSVALNRTVYVCANVGHTDMIAIRAKIVLLYDI